MYTASEDPRNAAYETPPAFPRTPHPVPPGI